MVFVEVARKHINTFASAPLVLVKRAEEEARHHASGVHPIVEDEHLFICFERETAMENVARAS